MMKNISVNRNIGFAVGVITLVFILNYNTLYFGLSSNLFGICVAVFLFLIGGRPANLKISFLLVGLIFILEFISFRLHTKSLHFLAICLFVCLVFYLITQRFSFIAFICILLFSSVFNKFFEHATTEIKQFLCELVFHTLKDFMNLSKFEGIHFYRQNQKLSIDTACMGLSMFKTGFLVAAILLTYEEKKSKLFYLNFKILTFCVLVVFLNLFSNYFRIILLLILDCTQENLLHHVVGLCCFVLYQVLPMVYLLRFFRPTQDANNQPQNNYAFWSIVFVTVALIITSLEMKTDYKNDLLQGLDANYDLNKGVWIDNNVFKIATASQIIYIKTISHKPLICWTGDGYQILNSRKTMIDKQEVWCSDMQKNYKTYQSIWWYEFGSKKYTSFIEVMFLKLLSNRPTRMINIVSIKN